MTAAKRPGRPRPQPCVVVERVYATERGAGGEAIADLLIRNPWALAIALGQVPVATPAPPPTPAPDKQNGQRRR